MKGLGQHGLTIVHLANAELRRTSGRHGLIVASRLLSAAADHPAASGFTSKQFDLRNEFIIYYAGTNRGLAWTKDHQLER
jgi:hypothetical protein